MRVPAWGVKSPEFAVGRAEQGFAVSGAWHEILSDGGDAGLGRNAAETDGAGKPPREA